VVVGVNCGPGTQVIERHLDIRVIDRPLENLAIHLEDGGPDWFRLLHHSADRALKGITFYRTLDFHEEAKLPFSTAVTRFLRKPYVELCASQRKRPVIRFHPTASSAAAGTSPKSGAPPPYGPRTNTGQLAADVIVSGAAMTYDISYLLAAPRY
jgi:hypothetical protein